MSSPTKYSGKIAVESQYFGSIVTYAAMANNKECLLEKFENYNKRSFRNRMIISTANGLLTLSIPLKKGKNSQCAITDVAIDNSVDWQKKHWQAITSAYRNSPFFQYFEDDLKPFYTNRYEKLYDFNKALLVKTVDWLNLEITVTETTVYEENLNEEVLDFRNRCTIKNYDNFELASYQQVFFDRQTFQNNLSILDLIFNLGNESLRYLNHANWQNVK